MAVNYQHRRHNKNLLMVHLIFATKYRRKLLTGGIRELVKQGLYDACTIKSLYVIRMETDRDHVHMLIQYKPTDRISDIVSWLKQFSTNRIWDQAEAQMRVWYWKKRILWSDGYFAASIGQVSQATIEHYIENQG